MNLVTPKAGAKHELLFNKPASADEKKLLRNKLLHHFVTSVAIGDKKERRGLSYKLFTVVNATYYSVVLVRLPLQATFTLVQYFWSRLSLINSCCFRCDRIHERHFYEYSHTLLCC